MDAAHRPRRALLLVSFVALVPMGVESLASGMLFGMLAAAGDVSNEVRSRAKRDPTGIKQTKLSRN